LLSGRAFGPRTLARDHAFVARRIEDAAPCRADRAHTELRAAILLARHTADWRHVRITGNSETRAAIASDLAIAVDLTLLRPRGDSANTRGTAHASVSTTIDAAAATHAGNAAVVSSATLARVARFATTATRIFVSGIAVRARRSQRKPYEQNQTHRHAAPHSFAALRPRAASRLDQLMIASLTKKQ
jgi:hypothetical protein